MKKGTGNCSVYEEMIADSVAGTLSEKDSSYLRNHVVSCERCAKEIAELESMLVLVQSAERPDPGELFFRRILRSAGRAD